MPLIRPGALLLFQLACALVPPGAFPENDRITVSATPDGAAQITVPGRRKIVVPKEYGQAGISDTAVAADGTAGWLVTYNVDGVSYPISGKLVVWRDGRVIQRFESEQVFYSWAFVAGSKQIAYHDGPLHGEQASHCELHDLATGRVIDKWEGDLEGAGKPAWTEGLKH
ncbi:MAG TPA: hypothetical protein VKT49_23810 [Bryobacteraceae bacterium]|nr:hypothetical protein [Bryobacteraceae bacterium]